MTAETAQVRWLDRDQQRSWRALLLGMTLLLDRLDDELREEFRISLTEYEILVRLSEARGRTLRMSELADALAHSRSRVTHTVARLEAAKLVRRQPSTADGRGVDCRLTERGWKLLGEMAPVHVRGVRAHLINLVDPDDFATVGRVMNAVADNLVSRHPAMELRDGI